MQEVECLLAMHAWYQYCHPTFTLFTGPVESLKVLPKRLYVDRANEALPKRFAEIIKLKHYHVCYCRVINSARSSEVRKPPFDIQNMEEFQVNFDFQKEILSKLDFCLPQGIKCRM